MGGEAKGERFLQRRQQRIDRRRGEILTAAAQVIAEKGYANTTTREIADAAEIAEGTLYNYFPSKREVLLAMVEETPAPMESALAAAGDIRDRDTLVDLVDRMLEMPVSRIPFLRAVLAEAWTDDQLFREFGLRRLATIHRVLSAFIARRVADGSFRSVDPGLTARMIIGMFAAVLLPMLRGVSDPPSPPERRAIAEAMAALLLDGVLAPQSSAEQG